MPDLVLFGSILAFMGGGGGGVNGQLALDKKSPAVSHQS